MRDWQILAGAGVLALLFFGRRANAAEPFELSPVVDVYIPGEVPSWFQPGWDDWAPEYPPTGVDLDTPENRLRAFLYMIRGAEHTRDDALSNRAYQTFYGGARFANMSDHPVITGERRGVRLPDNFCRAAGFNPGCVSTAAGAYQIIRPTWERVRRAGSWGPRLPDFTAASQDEAARRLLLECGALKNVYAGDFAPAVAKASRVWASLPGSTAGQGGRSFAQVQSYYDEGLRVA